MARPLSARLAGDADPTRRTAFAGGLLYLIIWGLSIGLWMAFVGFRRSAPLVVAAREQRLQQLITAGGVA